MKTQKTHNNLPLYILDVDSDISIQEGVDAVALVDAPAIKRGFLAFRSDTPTTMAFTVTSEDRHIISGPLMLADTPLLRLPPQVPEPCYITFPAATIERIAQKFFTQGFHASVNEMHDPERKLDGIVMFESFISDSTRGILPIAGHGDAPEGSWFGSFKVENEDAWKSIKDGTFTGFSVEGFFAYLEAEDVEATPEQQALLAQIWDVLENVAD